MPASSLPLRRLAATVALAAALVVNALANRLPLGGRTTGELSALYPNLFVPAGVTFSIWGVIYLLLLAWTVAQFRASHAELGRELALPFALTSILNGSWLLAWHYEQVALSVAIMVALLGTLIGINARLASLGRGRSEGPGRSRLAAAAFGVYLGWILVATLVNITAFLVAAGWRDGLGGVSDAVWAGILVVVGAGVAGFTLLRLANPWIGASVVWAFGGIALNRWDDVPGVAWTAVAMMGVVALVSGVARARSRVTGSDLRS